ncbi:MAG: Rpn family recombination-promoting nuclease/putative transposase [Treponema sp.]|nr:Rpn family recombination-promoting nuclease/putative transposase [Treponema sp.]
MHKGTANAVPDFFIRGKKMNQNQKTQTLEEKWQNATIAHNFIFYKVMRNNPDVCKELLEILLEFKIERIEMSQEEEINIDFDSKGIRMDVYAKDADGQKVYNIELQSTNTKELPERSRYYQGVIDVDLLKSGQKYKDLKTSFVIFICVDDIFGNGLPKYTFENLCVEDPKIKLNDRTFKYFFISKNCDKILNERQKAFLRMVIENKASDEFTGKVKKLVDDAKRNAQWRKQYMEWEREKTYIREDAIEEGRSQGKEEKAVEAALTLIRDYNETPEVAAEKMGAPLDLVLEALKENATE